MAAAARFPTDNGPEIGHTHTRARTRLRACACIVCAAREMRLTVARAQWPLRSWCLRGGYGAGRGPRAATTPLRASVLRIAGEAQRIFSSVFSGFTREIFRVVRAKVMFFGWKV